MFTIHSSRSSTSRATPKPAARLASSLATGAALSLLVLGAVACGEEPSTGADGAPRELAAQTANKPVKIRGLNYMSITSPANKSWVERKGQTHFVIRSDQAIDFELNRKTTWNDEWVRLYPFEADKGKAVYDASDERFSNTTIKLVGYDYTFDTSLQHVSESFSKPGPTKGGGQRSNASYYAIGDGFNEIELYSECGFENQECCWGDVDRCAENYECNDSNVCAQKPDPKPDPKPQNRCGGVGEECCPDSACYTANSICASQDGGARVCIAPGDVWSYQCECAGSFGNTATFDVNGCFNHDAPNPAFNFYCNLLAGQIDALVCAAAGTPSKASTSSCAVAPGAFNAVQH